MAVRSFNEWAVQAAGPAHLIKAPNGETWGLSVPEFASFSRAVEPVIIDFQAGRASLFDLGAARMSALLQFEKVAVAAR
jgi:hypothetical protein